MSCVNCERIREWLATLPGDLGTIAKRLFPRARDKDKRRAFIEKYGKTDG